MNIFRSGLGVALGGGAALGASHVGVLKALEEHGRDIQYISGTSIGALIAALYAFGLDLDEIEEVAVNLDWLDVSGLTLSKMGLLSNDKLGDVIEEHLGEVCIEDAEIKLAIIATDLSSGKKVVFREGDLAQAVMASACVPGLFIPVELNGQTLVDGGLVENVPVECLRQMGARKVIAVDINALRLYQQPTDIIEVILNSLDIGMENIANTSRDDVDLLIRPKLNSFSRAANDDEVLRDMIRVGYEAAEEQLS